MVRRTPVGQAMASITRPFSSTVIALLRHKRLAERRAGKGGYEATRKTLELRNDGVLLRGGENPDAGVGGTDANQRVIAGEPRGS